ncbi:hydratase [Yoonia sediminilitoris]|uniref:2-keto-4-pentenoate hydratase n=1 Tax=Yoonia sediminilitoris TaxID=1286148 RepID=A0A2T6KMJ6_9RHOB|nr:hydratase [Yoonia sediminilitoris]PUB17440.1 2-keto-4-pentenoate hydratase [Yoonia sediminilitoris]RCW97735.1 2-keto-4-pentenoate hydratase [Yoonia sediminilitoris]
MRHLDAFADGLITAHQNGQGFFPKGLAPKTPAEAYYVQDRVVAALGPVAGFKTARKPGQATIMAPILDRFAFATGASVPIGDSMGLELEIGWQIIAPLPEASAGDLDAKLRHCVRPVPVIELVDCRLRGPVAQDPVAKLADFQINKGVIIGRPLDDWDGRDFGAVKGRMVAGDQTLLDGPAEVPGGSALTTLGVFLAEIGARGGGLDVGQVVITGSLHPLTYVALPCEVLGRIDGLGTVAVTLSGHQRE